MYALDWTPVNQVRLTNVAYVRYMKGGNRFEIACYRNKVLNWRDKIETDIRQVLQIDAIFSNVSKGNLANSKDLQESFGTKDTMIICKEILNKGELQVSEQERVALFDVMFRDIAAIVSEKTINPDNNRPYTTTIIQNAMKQIHYSVVTNKTAKKQALDVINRLKNVMPIVRMHMLLRVIVDNDVSNLIETLLFTSFEPAASTVSNKSHGKVENKAPVQPLLTLVQKGKLAGSNSDNSNGQSYWDIRCEPELYKKITELIAEYSTGKGRVEILKLKEIPSSVTTAPTVDLAQSSISTASNETNPILDESMDAATQDALISESESGEEEEEAAAEVKKVKKVTAKPSVQPRFLPVDDDDDDDEEEEEEEVGHLKGDGEMIGRESNESAPEIKEAQEIGEESSAEEEDAIAALEALTIKNKAKVGKKGKKARRLEKELELENELKLKKEEERRKLSENRASKQVKEEVKNELISPVEVALPTPPVKIYATLRPDPPVPAVGSNASTSSCVTCGGCFADAAEYRQHFRSDWHRYNLQQKLKLTAAQAAGTVDKTTKIVSYEEFMQIPATRKMML